MYRPVWRVTCNSQLLHFVCILHKLHVRLPGYNRYNPTFSSVANLTFRMKHLCILLLVTRHLSSSQGTTHATTVDTKTLIQYKSLLNYVRSVVWKPDVPHWRPWWTWQDQSILWPVLFCWLASLPRMCSLPKGRARMEQALNGTILWTCDAESGLLCECIV